MQSYLTKKVEERSQCPVDCSMLVESWDSTNIEQSIGFSVVDFRRSEPYSIINYQDDVSLTSAIIHYSIEDLTDYRHTNIRYLTVRILGYESNRL